MALTLEEIIAEADILVPNGNQDPEKTAWLNEINSYFFEVVKIPNIAPFTNVIDQADYILTGTIKARNISQVQTGSMKYKNILFEDVKPFENYFTFDEPSKNLTLSPAPIQAGNGIAKYASVAKTTFLSSDLSVNPDAPDEYHWIYVLGLCEKIALAMDDIQKANNYGQDYRNALTVAAQNYASIGGANA